jgi:hypothetical protein
VDIINFDVDAIAEKVMEIVRSAGESRDLVVIKHEKVFFNLFEKYDVKSCTFDELGRIFAVMGDQSVQAEYDSLNKDWFVVKQRCGVPEPPDDVKVRYLAYVRELTSLGNAVVEDMKVVLKEHGLIYDGCVSSPSDALFILYAKYIDDDIEGTVVIPAQRGESVSFFARIR